MATPVTISTETILAAQGGDADAMWQIVSAYEPMLKSVVRSVAPAASADTSEDLLQEARAVLIQHVRAYSTETDSAQLHSFAYRAIRRAVAEEWLRSTTSLSVDPSAALAVRRALWTTEGDVEGAWMIVSSVADPRRRMSREAFVSMCEALTDVMSLEGPTGGTDGDGNGQTLADTIPDASSTFTDATERRDLARYLLSEIPQRRAYALRAFYGIGMQTRTDQEVAADLDVRPGGVRVLRSQGLDSARKVANRFELRVTA
ncbi:sigma-70 family RNA polymerase sigma factor [Streptomyces sp. SID2119]|uniref:sigma-70 family RNA polymerase sigma factor n=1 Tax=Streptomyces sp. SID2119 TaxID=2690253 RepID=UPI00137024D2|nr:sigma-70 family RNA polymerase sigma factor [Streptomyces sp. SID2119]MYW28213.1 sigma-70 family RNA polymerase sigma factor [Streptomyces sp. SID2119]